uniref:Uncharacterized protein n=1 Tax=Oryza glumipatula TaxID=40148 RepID=A0A0D9ZWS8_9ORYZ
MPAAGARVPVAAGASSAASAGVVGNHRWELRHSGGAVQWRRAPRVPRRRGGALEHRRRAHWPGRCSRILQCAVSFHHLFNQASANSASCVSRSDTTSSFSRFEEEVTAALNFIYRTQKELAACNDDLCLTMDGSVTSYQLLGNFAAGQKREKEQGKAAVAERGRGGGAERRSSSR